MKPDEKLMTLGASVVSLREKIEQLTRRKADVLCELKILKDKVEKSPPDSDVRKLLPDLESLKDIERKESELESHSAAECLKLKHRINELEKILQNVDNEVVADVLDHSLSELNTKVNQAKEGLAIKCRTVLLLKKQLDGIPSQGELIQESSVKLVSVMPHTMHC